MNSSFARHVVDIRVVRLHQNFDCVLWEEGDGMCCGEEGNGVCCGEEGGGMCCGEKGDGVWCEKVPNDFNFQETPASKKLGQIAFRLYVAHRPVVPKLFSVMDPFVDLAESCGPLLIKPDSTVTYKRFLLEKAIIRFAQQKSRMFHGTYHVINLHCCVSVEMFNEWNCR